MVWSKGEIPCVQFDVTCVSIFCINLVKYLEWLESQHTLIPERRKLERVFSKTTFLMYHYKIRDICWESISHHKESPCFSLLHNTSAFSLMHARWKINENATITTRPLVFWLLFSRAAMHDQHQRLVFTQRCLVTPSTSAILFILHHNRSSLWRTKIYCISIPSNQHLYIQAHRHKPRAVCAWLVTWAWRGEERRGEERSMEV
jgi:hypothetical protein